MRARGNSKLTDRGVELIRARLQATPPQPPALTATAALMGVNVSTLVRACQRAGLVLPQGRPRRTPPAATHHPEQMT